MTWEDTWIMMKLWVHYYIDLTKAIDHQLMLQKLQNIGVDGIELVWFWNYLCGRMQCVAIGKARSSLKPISSGVPQGSILGPLLFIIFMNNLPAVVSSCNIQLYVMIPSYIIMVRQQMKWNKSWQLGNINIYCSMPSCHLQRFDTPKKKRQAK